jgi:hypothetical protein
VKILLDEGVPEVIQQRLLAFSIFTVEQMGWRSLKNGELLNRMMGEFQIIITTDKSLPFQQNLKKRQISAIILPTNEIPAVINLLPQLEIAIATIEQGDFKELKMI